MIAALLGTSKIKIRARANLTSQVNALRGVPQNRSLSPSLINLAVDHPYRDL